MSRNRRKHNKQGIALVSVMLLCTAIVTMLSVLAYNSKTKKATQTFHYETTKALLAANAAIQIATYKYRALPSEYYKIQEMEIQQRISGVSNPKLAEAKQVWLSDLNSESAEIGLIKETMNSFCIVNDPKAVATITFAVDSFDLVSSEETGYTQDYIRIKAWGKCGAMRKDVEELIQVTIAH